MMIFLPDVTIGDKFGRLTVIGIGRRSPTSRQWYWKCRCECGNEKEIMGCNIREGKSLSCGCLQKERAGDSHRTHGGSGSKLHAAWKNIKQRCRNKNNTAYHNYGGRGIDICEEWANSFVAFKEALGEPPSSTHSIDRIDNNKGYEPGNVRWATPYDQGINRRHSVYVDFGGRKHLKRLCDETGVNYYRAYDMIVRRKFKADDVMKILSDSKKPPEINPVA
jgi:hypothetical protein